jgi:hypothetical protein
LSIITTPIFASRKDVFQDALDPGERIKMIALEIHLNGNEVFATGPEGRQILSVAAIRA